MAEHIQPAIGEIGRLKQEFLATGAHQEAAKLALIVLREFPSLDVRDIQVPKDRKYTCWYVSILGYPKCPVLNLGLFPKGTLDVEFRYLQFLPIRFRDGLRIQTSNWLCARIAESKFTFDQVHHMLSAYVPQVTDAANQGTLRRGGTSFAETIVEEILQDCLGFSGLSCHVRPEWLRNPEGNLLEIDILLESMAIAIEIQGPQHKKDLYGDSDSLKRRIENDRYKAQTCMSRGISLICLDSEGIQSRDFLRMQSKQQSAIFGDLISAAQRHSPCHIEWINKDIPYKLRSRRSG